MRPAAQRKGGQTGSTFDLKVTGQDLVDVETLHFNFPGVQVEAAGSEKTPIVPTKKQPVKPPPALTTRD